MALYHRQLLAHEHWELLEALRRDMRNQQDLANKSGEWAEWHRYNARMVKHLLEAINPKRPRPNNLIDVYCEKIQSALSN